MTTSLFRKLKNEGGRLTEIRKQMVTLLEKARNPVSVSEMLSKIDANKTTIYRQLTYLKLKKMITEVDLLDGKKRYELSEKGHHHHLICTNCGKILEITLKSDLKKEEQLIEKQNNFKVTKHSLEFFGLCANCQ